MICERWVMACQTLTSQYWKRYGPNPWKAETFVPESLNQLAKRIDEVIEIGLLSLLGLFACVKCVANYGKILHECSHSMPCFWLIDHHTQSCA